MDQRNRTVIFCNQCLQDCSALRYHCEECDDYDLCPSCYDHTKHKKITGQQQEKSKDDSGSASSTNSAHHCHDDHRDSSSSSLSSSFWTSRLTAAALEIRRDDPSQEKRSVGEWALQSLAAWPSRPFVGVKRSKPTEADSRHPAEQQPNGYDTCCAPPFDNYHNGYHYVSHGNVLRRAIALSRRLHQILQHHQYPSAEFWNNEDSSSFSMLEPTDTPSNDQHAPRVALWAPNSLEWVVTDVALALQGFVSVPLDAGLQTNADKVHSILESTQSRLLLVHPSLVDRAKRILSQQNDNHHKTLPHLLAIVVLGTPSSSFCSNSSSSYHLDPEKHGNHEIPIIELGSDMFHNLTLTPQQELLAGQDLIDALFASPTEQARLVPTERHKEHRNNRLFSIIYTSGSTTGSHKGTMQTHHAWCQGRFGNRAKPHYYVAALYRPLSYLVDRSHLWDALGCGGRVALIPGGTISEGGGHVGNSKKSTSMNSNHKNTGLLFEQLQLIHPTGFSGPPSVLDYLHQQFQRDLLEEMRNDCSNDPGSKLPHKNTIAAKSRQRLLRHYSDTYLGRRCKILGVGGAKPSAELISFLKECFSTTTDNGHDDTGCMQRSRTKSRIVYEGYGSTEIGSITCDGKVLGAVIVKLVDVPELGYLVAENGCGEICVQPQRGGILGYWRNPKATAELFYTDPETGQQWYRTGDIGREHVVTDGPQQQHQPNGEATVTRAIQIVDRKSNFVKLSNSVFLSPETCETLFRQHCPSIQNIFIHADPGWRFPMAVVVLSSSTQSLTFKNSMEVLVLHEMRQCALKHSDTINTTEVPHHVIIAQEPFSVHNGCLTVSLKLCRPGLRLLYVETLRDRYSVLINQAERRAASKPKNESELVSHLCQLYAVILGHVNITVTPNFSASQLGADSFTLVELKNRLESDLGFEASLDFLWNIEIDQLATQISEENSAGLTNTSALERGAGLEDLVDRLHKDSVFRCDVTQSNKEKYQGCKSHVQDCECLLLTGATGFVGSHVLAELLENHPDLAILCLVRKSPNQGDASKRLEQEFQRVVGLGILSSILSKRLERRTVRVIACDLSMDLCREPLSVIGSSVTHIIHAAADVNHVKPYSALVDSNVNSVKHLIRKFGRGDELARLKSFVFVSTTAVVPLTQSQSVGIESPVREELSSAEVSKRSGYALSKWAAERFLENWANCTAANSAVTIARCGMNSWSTQTGLGNSRDWLTALTKATQALRFAPDGKRFLNLTPVNWTAAALVSLSLQRLVTKSVSSADVMRGNPRRVGIAHLVSPCSTDIEPLLLQAAMTHGKDKIYPPCTLSEPAWSEALRKEASNKPDLSAAALLLGHRIPRNDARMVTPLAETRRLLVDSDQWWNESSLMIQVVSSFDKFLEWATASEEKGQSLPEPAKISG